MITCWTFTAGVAERIIVEDVVEVTKTEPGTFVVIVRWHVLREIILILIILMAGMSCEKQFESCKRKAVWLCLLMSQMQT